MSRQPYKYWNRGKLYEALIPQCIEWGISTYSVKEICYSYKWNPITDYNGCTLVQDDYHPFVPCLIHDYRWITGEGGLDSDLEFKINLQKSGKSVYKSWMWFIGVRLGWLCYYKWKLR